MGDVSLNILLVEDDEDDQDEDSDDLDDSESDQEGDDSSHAEIASSPEKMSVGEEADVERQTGSTPGHPVVRRD